MSKKNPSAAGKSERAARVVRSNLYAAAKDFPAFMDLPSSQLLRLMQELAKDTYQMTAFSSFVDKFRISISELTTHDIDAVKELDVVRRTMEE
jgi:hypothetical protein